MVVIHPGLKSGVSYISYYPGFNREPSEVSFPLGEGWEGGKYNHNHLFYATIDNKTCLY
jgi:hypothetical protein